MMPVAELRYLLRTAAAKDTSSSPVHWTKENPTYGHCAVFTTIVQDFLGGTIKRGLLPNEWIPRLGYRSHYWNIIDSNPVDLSWQQFPDGFPYKDFIAGAVGDSKDGTDKRDYILENPEKKWRYQLLKTRVAQILDANRIFYDLKYQRCWELALSEKTKCSKMRFACLVYDRKTLLAEDVNRSMAAELGKERFCSFDGLKCIRIDMPSRTDAAIGDCGHAPIWCLKRVFNKGYKPADLSRLDFFEAGFFPDGSPWFRKEASYTCISCQNDFTLFGLDKISVPFNDEWRTLLTKDSFYSAAEYAYGIKQA